MKLKLPFAAAFFLLALMPFSGGELLAQSSGGSGFITTSADSSISPDKKQLRFEDYEARLNALLKTRRDEEKQFLAAVLLMVMEDKLPERLIETSYKWVVNKRPDTNYPFIYFERVLRIQANLLKIPLPAFDYSIYKTRPDRSAGN